MSLRASTTTQRLNTSVSGLYECQWTVRVPVDCTSASGLYECQWTVVLVASTKSWCNSQFLPD